MSRIDFISLVISGASTFFHAAAGLQSRHCKLPQQETISAVPYQRE